MTEQHRHITDEMWGEYAQGTMSADEEEQLYTHIGHCTYCAERFANIVETDFFAEPPSYLYEEIAERSRKADVQAAATVRKTSKKMKLLFYSLKVGFAVAASIFLLTITPSIGQNPLELPETKQQESRSSITEKLNDKSYKFTGYLQDATNRLLEYRIKEEE